MLQFLDMIVRDDLVLHLLSEGTICKWTKHENTPTTILSIIFNEDFTCKDPVILLYIKYFFTGFNIFINCSCELIIFALDLNIFFLIKWVFLGGKNRIT